ncbi:hypothetical protein [Chromobacterium haemolyticum]|uniref:hypothetical protein n=1 Tax=Chromobacterium haemolyticum TaxID=394935 RepID=UPI0012FB1505|nr:hypothetical protein [Chromobacterium haemolyticum]
MNIAKILTVSSFSFLLLASASVNAAQFGGPNTKDDQKSGQCYAEKSCSGKVIENGKDAQSCKKAQGKSWLSSSTGKCSNL